MLHPKLTLLHYASHLRSGRPDEHQSFDAVVEEVNGMLKSWVSGDHDSDMWQQLVRNFEKLRKMRSQVRFLPTS